MTNDDDKWDDIWYRNRRNDDPHTSDAAARQAPRYRRGSQRHRLLITFWQYDDQNAWEACVVADLADKGGSPWKRVSELREDGFIRIIPGADRPGRFPDSDQLVYKITQAGKDRLIELGEDLDELIEEQGG